METDEKWAPESEADEKWPPDLETERKWPPNPDALLKFLAGVLVFFVLIAWYQKQARREYIAGENGAVIEIDRWNRTATECWPNGVCSSIDFEEAKAQRKSSWPP